MELDDRRVITDIPLLLIDDECDYASVNTKQPERDENGNIVEDWNPTETNRQIRMLLFIFQKVHTSDIPQLRMQIFLSTRTTIIENMVTIFSPDIFIISLPSQPIILG